MKNNKKWPCAQIKQELDRRNKDGWVLEFNLVDDPSDKVVKVRLLLMESEAK